MRPDKDAYFLRHATIAAQMSTCKRRAVGCVVVNARKQILGIGFNGVPAGMPHCNEGHPCPGADAPSGTSLDKCYATHAEVNAVLQCRDPYAIETAYTTTAPCIDCTKYLMNTSAKRIVFVEAYPHAESQRLWEGIGRSWEHQPFGPGGHWDIEPTHPVPILTGTDAYHHEECPKCHGRGFVRVLDGPPSGLYDRHQEPIDHGPFRKYCDCGRRGNMHISDYRVICDNCNLPLAPEAKLLSAKVAARLEELRAERARCVGGGYAGRIKMSLIDAQIRDLEDPPRPDPNCTKCAGSGMAFGGEKCSCSRRKSSE